jgi:hypothetical protein
MDKGLTHRTKKKCPRTIAWCALFLSLSLLYSCRAATVSLNTTTGKPGLDTIYDPRSRRFYTVPSAPAPVKTEKKQSFTEKDWDRTIDSWFK